MTKNQRDFEQELQESIADMRNHKRGEKKLRTRIFVSVPAPAGDS